MTHVISTLLDATSPVAKAALRSIGNGAICRAANLAMRLARQYSKHIGNGIDGANDLLALISEHRASAEWMNGTGREAQAQEETLNLLVRIHYAIHARTSEESYFRPMSLEEALDLVNTPQQVKPMEVRESLDALIKISGKSEAEILALHTKANEQYQQRDAGLLPIAANLMESVAHDATDEDELFTDLPVTVQFGLLAKCTEAAAVQLDRDVVKAARYLNSPVKTLRDLAFSDTAAGKGDFDDLEKILAKFLEQHGHEIEI